MRIILIDDIDEEEVDDDDNELHLFPYTMQCGQSSYLSGPVGPAVA